MNKRPLLTTLAAEAVTDGDGVKIRRSVARRALHTYDPFLMLDEIASDEAADYIGGFPEHPHRGFETVTYMLEGSMRHRDHMGNEGLLSSGGVQWMTAGRGVLHSEMPLQESGRLHGFQLWINLPAAEKMGPPGYREFGAGEIPELDLGHGSRARVIAGTLALDGRQVTGPVRGVSTAPDYFDLNLAAGHSLAIPVAKDKRVLLYVYDGEITVEGGDGARHLPAQHLGALGDGDAVAIRATRPSRLLVLAGKPIGEPVVNWGPFVMNTQQEIQQAIEDYRNGTLV